MHRSLENNNNDQGSALAPKVSKEWKKGQVAWVRKRMFHCQRKLCNGERSYRAFTKLLCSFKPTFFFLFQFLKMQGPYRTMWSSLAQFLSFFCWAKNAKKICFYFHLSFYVNPVLDIEIDHCQIKMMISNHSCYNFLTIEKKIVFFYIQWGPKHRTSSVFKLSSCQMFWHFNTI